MSSPTLSKIHRTAGIAGQVQYSVDVAYPDEPSSIATFVGQDGQHGPVVMILPSGHQIFVTDPGRFGPFGKGWVTAFFA